MTSYTIPLEDAARLGAFSCSVDLDGTNFRLNFQFNSREKFWYFNLLDMGGTVLRSGVKIVSNYMLLRLFRARTRPLGELMSVDSRDQPGDPGLADLNVSSIFGYTDEETIDALLEALE